MTIFLNPFIADTDGDMLVDGTGANFNQHKVSWKYVKRFSYVYDELNRTWNYGTIPGEMNPDINTNPFSPDTDGDGIIDGYEVQNLSMLNIPEGEWYGVLHSKDYDGDGLPDSYEIRMAYYVNKYDTQNWSAGKYLNVTNATDAGLDFDSDGLTNLEEYQRDPQGDYDGDGTPDIYDWDDDNDSIPTGVELQNHLDPFNPYDANGDLDHDGLTNLFEYNNSLNMNDPDTDHDGINDGAELNYWNVTRGLDMDTSVEYCKIPDVDRDNITDGKEINGYKVKIITGWKSDGTPISVMRELKSDPLIPYGYNDSSGFHWSDTDSDGIPDVVESMLSNSSYFWAFYNFTQKNDWMKEEREKLWEDYNWTISYYFSLKLNESYDSIFTDIKNAPDTYIPYYFHLSPYNDSCGENATKYLTSQFNPFVKENMPPMMVKFTINGVGGKLYWHILIRDVGKISNILINDITGNGLYVKSNINAVEFEKNGSFSLSTSEKLFKVKIEVISYDTVGNKLDVVKKVNGILGEIVDVVLQFLKAIWDNLVEIGKMVAKVVNFIVEWIANLLINGINTLSTPFLNLLSGIIKNFVDSINDFIYGYKHGSSDISKYAKNFVDMFIHYSLIFMAIYLAIYALFYLHLPFTFAISIIINIVSTSLIITFIGSLEMPSIFLDFSKYNIKDIPSLVLQILGGQKQKSNDDVGAFLAWASLIFGLIGVLLTAILQYPVIGAIGFFASLMGFFLSTYYATKENKLCLGFIALLGGIDSAVTIALGWADENPWPKLIGVFGIVLAIPSITYLMEMS